MGNMRKSVLNEQQNFICFGRVSTLNADFNAIGGFQLLLRYCGVVRKDELSKSKAA
ncbi:MAG: hypothetical protein LBK56_09625 [Gracilibacteraceae bacterium]|nr:hypothetical protein [Gracilibacteraceae bacterium]